MMLQVPQKAPLPCYGLEHNRADPMCQQCPHFDGCLEHMGSRADKLPLEPNQTEQGRAQNRRVELLVK